MSNSLIEELATQRVWEEYLAYRLIKGRLNWHEFEQADAYVEREEYLPDAEGILRGEGLGVPKRSIINKMGTNKKRIVYSFDQRRMTLLKVLAYQLYRYDDSFAPNCYAFRQGLRPTDALLRLNRAVGNRRLWCYKVDVSNYFNSISVPLLLPKLKMLFGEDVMLYNFFEQMLTDQRAECDGGIIYEPRGVMAGTPTASFLANVYLSEMDHYFYKRGVVYARYSDDIVLFAEDRATLEEYMAIVARFLNSHRLEVNPSKERIYSPDEPYEFLGFRCLDAAVDISAVSVEKMKGKIRRKTRALMRWKARKDISPERAMARLIGYFNRKFYGGDEAQALTWARWYFPIINRHESLQEIDHYLQQSIRMLATGRVAKSNYRIGYDELKRLGYRSLVNEYYKWRSSDSMQ